VSIKLVRITMLAALALVGLTLMGASSASSLAGRVIAQGKITIGGQAASGVQVQVHAWPTSSVLGKLKAGQLVPWQLVGSATTAGDGSYAVTISSPAALTSSADMNGYVNLTVDAGNASWSFSRRLASGQALAMPNTDMNGVTAASPEVANLRPAGRHVCDPVPSLVKRLGNNWAIVGQSYATFRRVTHTFTYTEDQESSLGVGDSPTGKVGSFTVNGTWSQASTGTQAFPSFHKSNVWYRTEFKIGKFLRYCPALHIPKNYSVRVIGWAGGSSMLHPRVPPATTAGNCVNEASGARFSKDTSSAVTWSKGLTIAVVGFDASAHTGYDKRGKVDFHFGIRSRLCGTNDVPGGNPRQLVARLP
jgi:hypothetical protein